MLFQFSVVPILGEVVSTSGCYCKGHFIIFFIDMLSHSCFYIGTYIK